MRLLVLAALLACSGLACSSDSSDSDRVLGPDPVEENPADDNAEGDDEGGAIATFSSIQSNIFTPTCALSGCHDGGNFANSPNLSAGSAYDSLVGVASSQGTAYITAGDPDNSYLYRKITGASGIEGLRMPRVGDPLSDELIAAVRAWIEAGAPNN